MCDWRTSGHPELWLNDQTLPEDRGPEGNLEMWADAEEYLDSLGRRAEHRDSPGGEAALVALTDAYNRCIEERRRAEDLLRLHKAWRERRVGGVVDPGSPVRGPGG